MSLKKRLLFFGGGALIGVFFVWIIFDKKDVTFDYFPNDRVLKTLRTKQRVFDNKALQFFYAKEIDTAQIETFLTRGDVDFGQSKPREKPCNFYHIEADYNQKKIGLYVKNCDTLVTIQKGFEIN